MVFSDTKGIGVYIGGEKERDALQDAQSRRRMLGRREAYSL